MLAVIAGSLNMLAKPIKGKLNVILKKIRDTKKRQNL